MERIQVGLRLHPTLVRLVDEARGDVPRNAWLSRAVAKELRELGMLPPMSAGDEYELEQRDADRTRRTNERRENEE